MNVKRIILFFAAALGFLTACVENMSEPNDVNNLLSGVEAQVEAMQKSAEDMKALNEALGECGVDVADAEKAISQHLASIKKGASLETATLATLELQKKIAAVVGAAEGAVLFEEGYAKNYKKLFEDVNNGVAMWLGESFSAYYQVAVAQAKIDFVLGDLNPQIEDQQMCVDAIMSDIEAGLRKDENPAEITELAASVKKMSQESEDLASGLASLAEELEAEYKSAITANSDFDSETLIELNKTALTKADSATPTLVELAAEVVECQAKVEELTERLGEVEAEIGELIAMIQSLTFVSEYSDDKAVAPYDMVLDTVDPDYVAEGKKKREPAASFDLTFLVRPAAAATALAESWATDPATVDVIGYYAQRVEQAAINLLDFEVENAVATSGKGLITVTVKNDFDKAFYFKEKGAMLALSVESGKNNCSSKFVEIVPRDNSGKVYAESLVLTPDKLSIQDGDTYKLKAEVFPANVTDAGVVWANEYNSDYFDVDSNGNVTGKKASGGEASPVTVTANATDEWGRVLEATCMVTVTPAIRIVGQDTVEEGRSITFTLESPNEIRSDEVTWGITADNAHVQIGNYVTLTKDANSTGLTIKALKAYYDEDKKVYPDLTVICTVGKSNPQIITKTIRVLYVQPTWVRLKNGLADDVEKITVKVNTTYDLACDILPNHSIVPNADEVTVNPGIFTRCKFESNKEYCVSAGIANYDGKVQAVGVDVADVCIKVMSNIQYNYYPSANTQCARWFKFIVEPYYITKITLPETIELEPGDTGTLSAVLTSDVDGVPPTNSSLIWASSDPEVLEIDAETGSYEAKKNGSVFITATAPEGSVIQGTTVYASCGVTVAKKENAPKPGYFYYADGTWSETYTADASNPVIGIVFIAGNIGLQDTRLGTAYPNAINGVAVSIDEYSGKLGYVNTSAATNSPGEWMWNNNYRTYYLDDVAVGYSNSLGLAAWATYKGNNIITGTNFYPLELFMDGRGVADQHQSKVSPPTNASDWYVPSYFEMCQIYKNIGTINASISTVLGDQVSNSQYYMSSFQIDNTKYHAMDTYERYDMSSGTWGTQAVSPTTVNDAVRGAECPVRVVLAF